MIDCVYVLGTGSGWQDNELRYSLRSLEKFVSGIRDVYIVGHCPPWLTNVIHLPFPDSHGCKERNIMLKLAYACGHPDLSTNFLHIHDDHFALAPQEAFKIPNYAGAQLDKVALTIDPGNNWRGAVTNTFEALKNAGLPTFNFDVHYPMLFNKNLYPEIMDRFNWSLPRGFVVKSLYANSLKLTPTRITDIKLNNRYSYEQIIARIKGRTWYSIGNGALSISFKQLLEALYPKVSKYEK